MNQADEQSGHAPRGIRAVCANHGDAHQKSADVVEQSGIITAVSLKSKNEPLAESTSGQKIKLHTLQTLAANRTELLPLSRIECEADALRSLGRNSAEGQWLR